MELTLDPRLWVAVLAEMVILGVVIARRVRAQTGAPPGGTSPWAWGLLCGLLPFIGLLLLVEAIVRGNAQDRRDDDLADEPVLAPLGATILPAR